MILNPEADYPNAPILVEETAGTKFYCTCGVSASQPYCDGSHKGTGCAPLKVEIEDDRRVAYCGCRQSGKLPFCDGSHSSC